jgi:hypothetical protein
MENIENIIPALIVAYVIQALVLYFSNLSLLKPVFDDARTWIQLVLAFIVPILLPIAGEMHRGAVVATSIAETILVVLITVEFSVLSDFFSDRFLQSSQIRERSRLLAFLVLASAGLDIVSLFIISSSDGSLGPNTLLRFDASNCSEIALVCDKLAQLPDHSLTTLRPTLMSSLTGSGGISSLAMRAFVYSLAGVAFLSSVSSIIFASKERDLNIPLPTSSIGNAKETGQNDG